MEQFKKTVLKQMLYQYCHYITLFNKCDGIAGFEETAKEFLHKAQALREMILIIDKTETPVQDLSTLDYPDVSRCFFEENELVTKLTTNLF